jgi:hypothetical protein
MGNSTAQDLWVWADKLRQLAEQRSRSMAEVTMLEEAVSELDTEMVHAHHSSSQLDFAKTELARVNAQFTVALGKIREIVADMDAAKK